MLYVVKKKSVDPKQLPDNCNPYVKVTQLKTFNIDQSGLFFRILCDLKEFDLRRNGECGKFQNIDLLACCAGTQESIVSSY